MITLNKQGTYRLVETKNHVKILALDDRVFAWVDSSSIGEILVVTHRFHKAEAVLSVGSYVLYDVQDEPHISDQQHLELFVGEGKWQGYLLLTGLPDDYKKRARIIPTHEIITNNPRLRIRA